MIGGLNSHCLPCVCWCETPPPPFQASTPVCVCILPHRPRHDIGARALISQFLSVLTPIPSACRFYVGLSPTLLISVHVPSPSRVPPTLSSPPTKALVCHRSRKARRGVGSLSPIRSDSCLRDAVRALLAERHLRPRAIAVAGASDAVVAAVTSPGSPPGPRSRRDVAL